MSSALKFALVLTIFGARFLSTPILTSEDYNNDPKTNPSLHLPSSSNSDPNLGHHESPFAHWIPHIAPVR